jgi:hypothetical protein
LATVALADSHGSSDPPVMLVTGKHWVESDERAKVGYLYGAANFAHIEHAMQGDNVPGDRDSLVPVLVRGLDGRSVDEVKADLDNWYADNPDQIDRPVIETIYMEFALPNS